MLDPNKIYCGDCAFYLRQIEDNSVDLVIADPPYYHVVDEPWDNQWKDTEEYLGWMRERTALMAGKLKAGGALYVFGGIGPKNGFVFWDYIRETAKVLTFCSHIVWRKFRGKGYLGAHNNWPDCQEIIGYFIKGARPLVFNKQKMREAGLSSASQKRFRETNVGMVCTNVWIDIPESQLDGGMNRTLDNPAEKPVRLMERIVLASSNRDGLVVDPFCGTGNSLVAAALNGRNYVGMDLSARYCLAAEKKIDNLNKLGRFFA